MRGERMRINSIVVVMMCIVLVVQAEASLFEFEKVAVVPDVKTGLYVPLTEDGPGAAALFILARRMGLSVAAGIAERKESLWGSGGWRKLAGGAIVDVSSAFQFTVSGVKPEIGFMFDKDLGAGGGFGGAVFVTMTTSRIEDVASLFLAAPKFLAGLVGIIKEGE